MQDIKSASLKERITSLSEARQQPKDGKLAGLMRDDTGRFSIPLCGSKIDAHLVNFSSKVVLRQRFFNDDKGDVSATYVE